MTIHDSCDNMDNDERNTLYVLLYESMCVTLECVFSYFTDCLGTVYIN